jgi:hypothetical protein
LYGFDRLTVLPGVIAVEILPVPILMVIDDLRKLIDFELLILGGMGIVISPLFKWDVSTDKVNQPAVLLIKILNDLK